MIHEKPPTKKQLGKRNGLKIFTKLKTNQTFKKSSKSINKISESKKSHNRKIEEHNLKQELLKRCGGLCESCHKLPDFRGLSKHEKVFRSHGGSPTDINNCEMLCGKCHDAKHGIIDK